MNDARRSAHRDCDEFQEAAVSISTDHEQAHVTLTLILGLPRCAHGPPGRYPRRRSSPGSLGEAQATSIRLAVTPVTPRLPSQQASVTTPPLAGSSP